MESSSSAWRSLDPPSQVVSCMTCLYKRQLTTTSGGNVSVKDGNGSIWVTPTGIDKCNICNDQICCILPDRSIRGSYKPTSEWLMHFEAYEQRDSIGAIVHTHSPSILAFAISRKLPTVDTFVHVHRFLGGIASVPYCICGGKELADECAKAVAENPTCCCFVLQNHGALVVGENVEEAFARLELLEKIARLSLEIMQSSSPPLSTPYNDTIDMSRPCDATECVDIDTFAKRAYAQKLIVCEHFFSKRLSDANRFCYSPLLTLPPFASPTLFKSMVLTDASSSDLLRWHASLYTEYPAIRCIFQCLPLHASILLAQQRPIDADLMPESCVVLKEVAFIPFSSHSLQDLLAKAKEGCSVFLVERVGVIITATTLMQAFDRLEVLEATCEAIHLCDRLSIPIQQLNPQQIEEIKQHFG
ncbi:hypothetical protein WA588_004463, partial [Blastocystis sp. NMH]